MTETTRFGTSRRENHDASGFYSRTMYDEMPKELSKKELLSFEIAETGPWTNKLYLQSSEDMCEIPDNSISLAFTSPAYNAGKDFDEDLGLDDYLKIIKNVGKEVFRVLRPGGRYVINIANLGRKPYIPMHAKYYDTHISIGFLPMGEVIWRKAKGANGSCAWGSWMSAKAPRLRDIHEYLLIFAKHSFSRPDKGDSDISKEEFMESTLSVWEIPPESAKRVGHPAPFPIPLAERVIRLFSYTGDVILDPFVGSGTTCVAAKQLNRNYVGYDIEEKYLQIAEERLKDVE
ncbi:site-specific DNA-methyltransferase [bacterium]|nr:site-specific DNA-methyltransferase [bacterium]